MNTQGKRIGYIRVSTIEQNTSRQLDGVQLDKTFTDKASGKDTKRPELEALLDYVREGDVVIIHSMDRLARNVDDLRRIVKRLTSKRVKVEFVKEHLEFDGEDSPMSNMILTVMGAFAEFERAIILERQREGIAIAKGKGKYKGRNPALSKQQQADLKAMLEQGMKKTDIAERFGISRCSVYNYAKAS